MSQVLESLSFPLHGARLIEASAGTGKTFTIASLYLRLLLGHGSEKNRHKTPLTVDQILVVTFTEAATAELKGRIRERIHQARLAFARGKTSDPVLNDFLLEVNDHKGASQILLHAERQMDEAAIFTIHGFCQRMLTQHAFESKSAFEQELVTDLTQLEWQVVCDYWRAHFYPLSQELTTQVYSIFKSPHALFKSVHPYLKGPLPNFIQSDEALGIDLSKAFEMHHARILEVKQSWQDAGQDLYDVIDQSGINRRSYSKRNFPTWFENMSNWAQSDAPDYDLKLVEHFSAKTLAEKTDTAKGEVAKHRVFDLIESLIEDTPDFKNLITYQAIIDCRKRLTQSKLKHEQWSFDDLLFTLDDALSADTSGGFADKIAAQYPVAMIDEFQDTDPAQYHIFSQIYLNKPDTAWLMIGDPKQAIYSFRGADIFTYIKARNEVSAHYTLGTNWRSSEGMIQGVNHIFEFDDNPFIYQDDITFQKVDASPNADEMHWLLDEHIQAPIQLWLLEGDSEEGFISKNDYTHQMANMTAYQIHKILTQSDIEKAAFIDKKKHRQKIVANDIAVLVRTGREAAMVKQALASQGIASVYLSNRERVFDSAIAPDLLRLLYAVSHPENAEYLRAILASELFALDIRELDEINHNEYRWEAAVFEFQQYQLTWRKRGVLPMIYQVISQRLLAQKWLSHLEGERFITDLMHLAELLQEANQNLETEQALIRWLFDQIYNQETSLDEQTQRLESERALVQIVTIHKSKGLEYDFVFLPFLMNYRTANEAKFYDQSTQKNYIDLSQDKESLEFAEIERLAEDLRLLYVALTRGVYGCYIGLAPVVDRVKKNQQESNVHLSALGAILQHHQGMSAQGLIDACSTLVQSSGGHIQLSPLPEKPAQPYQKIEVVDSILTAKEMQRTIQRNWRVTSYSAIIKNASHQASTRYEASEQSSNDGAEVVNHLLSSVPNFDIDSLDSQQPASLEQIQHQILEDEIEHFASIFDFPRGAAPGTFLHTLFELVDFQDPSSQSNQDEVMKQLELAHLDSNWLPVLMRLIECVLTKDLDGQGLKLTAKTPQQCLVEMEFLLPIESLPSRELNQIIQSYDPLSKCAGKLHFETIEGMLKGFIDLVFEHQGRYYVLDWKSNHLGNQIEDYQLPQIENIMVEHRYDLQYQIYTLALHRYLKTRIANYDYQTHFGGVYYLFLRGIRASTDNHLAEHGRSGIFFTKPDAVLIEQLDQLIENALNQSHLKQEDA